MARARARARMVLHTSKMSASVGSDWMVALFDAELVASLACGRSASVCSISCWSIGLSMRWPAPPHEKRTGGEGAGGRKSVHVGEQLELHLLIAPAADRAGSNARADAAEQGLKQGTYGLHLERSENLISVVYQVTEHSRWVPERVAYIKN